MGRNSARISAAERPFFVTVADKYSPLGVVILSNWETSTPAFFGEGMGGGSGLAIFEGNVHRWAGDLLRDIGLRAGIFPARTARRRGVSK